MGRREVTCGQFKRGGDRKRRHTKPAICTSCHHTKLKKKNYMSENVRLRDASTAGGS